MESEEITATYEEITPETAKEWLKLNTVNRKRRDPEVDKYAADMKAGRWKDNDQAISFDVNGKMINGQHRLQAVIKSGVTIRSLIVRGMPTASMEVMDSGIRRTAADALSLSDEANPALLASTIKQCLIWVDGRIYKDNKTQAVSHLEIKEFLHDNPDIRYSVRVASRLKDHIMTSPTAIAASHWIIGTVNDTSVVDLFFNQIATRVDEPAGSAVHAIDSRLRQIRLNRQTVRPREYLYLFMKAWNHYAANSSVKTISVTTKKGSEFKIPDPIRWSRPFPNLT